MRARMGFLIAALSAAYSAAMFRGLENHPSYYGSAYQALNPGAFPGDPFMGTHRPIFMSLYYLLVKLVGPVWMDDRFTLLIFFAMTVVSLVVLDKTARLLGCVTFWERAAILAFVLLEHKFFIAHVLLVDNYGFNATAFGGAVALWLLYGALAGWGVNRQLPLAVLGMGLSPKNCWLPVLVAAILFWKDRLRSRGKFWALLAAGLAGAGGLVFYYAYLRPADGTDVPMFNIVLALDNQEAHPFLYPLWCNLVFAGFCLLVFLPLGLKTELTRRVRWVAAIGLLAWLLGGLYLSYAPDALKIPALVPFDLRRALRWPTYVVYVTLGVSLLKRFQETRISSVAWLSGLAFLGLYLVHREFRLNLAVLLGSTLAGMLLLYRRFSPLRLSADERLRVIAVPVVIGTFCLYAIGAVRNRWAALDHLARHGILGDNPTAKWVGITEYIREKTVPSSTVLAFSMENTHRQPAPLGFDGSLRTRAGRSMAMGHPASFYMDYGGMLWAQKRDREMADLALAWEQEDLPAVSQGLRRMGSPDLLVIPTQKSQWVEQSPEFDYRLETRIGGFTLFRLTRDQRRNDATRFGPASRVAAPGG